MKKNNLYKYAKKVILGGNMLLSKRPEMFLLIIGPHIIQNLRAYMFGI
jgi:hypothetical protein